jgi:Fe-Mn family superoxide dismutase
MQSVGVAGGLALMAGATSAKAAPAKSIDHSPLTLPPALCARSLAPVISARTVDFHYNKHHAGYFTNLGKLVAGTPLAGASLEEVILASAGVPEKKGVFNNAAQAWNHNLYWQSLSPTPSTPSPRWPPPSRAILARRQHWTPIWPRPPWASSAAAGHGWCWTRAS